MLRASAHGSRRSCFLPTSGCSRDKRKGACSVFWSREAPGPLPFPPHQTFLDFWETYTGFTN